MGAYYESDFENGSVLPYLTSLGWMQGVDTQVDPSRWVYTNDLLAFLKEGNPQNQRAFAAVKRARKFSTDQDFYQAFCTEALDPLLRDAVNSAYILKQTIQFEGHGFTLLNHYPVAGDPASQQQEYAKNHYRVVPQLRFSRARVNNTPFLRRPDLVFFVNGLYYGLCELKLGQRGQSARTNGREKIAVDLVDTVSYALEQAIAAYPGVWPGWRHNKLTSVERNQILLAAYPYTKAVHLVTMDMHEVWVCNRLNELVGDIEGVLLREHDHKATMALREKCMALFEKCPTSKEEGAFAQVLSHLSDVYHPRWGVDITVSYFEYTQPKKNKKRGGGTYDIRRVRAPQRTMLVRAVQRAATLFSTAPLPKLLGNHYAHHYTNGKHSYPILLQGAAGFGKTSVMTTLAAYLASMTDPQSQANARLFDLVLVVSDRTELRTNAASEALRTPFGSMTFEVKTTQQLEKALTSQNNRILVVNMQKFPALVKSFATKPALLQKLQSLRVAMLIDEVHRSQSGVYHDNATELFECLDTFSQQLQNPNAPTKKYNLVVGFTATPRDEELCRFGEWVGPQNPADKGLWTPYFSYSLGQALEDGLVLDVTSKVVKLQEVYHLLDINDKASDIADTDFYNDTHRIQLIAKKFVRVFATETIYSGCRPVGRGWRTTGNGKAMVATFSVSAAIDYQREIQKELKLLAKDPMFDHVAPILENTFVGLVFSSNNTEKKHSRAFNNGMSEEAVIDRFRGIRCNDSQQNGIMVVVDKLLTGFDEPSLHTMLVDKPLNDVALLQGLSRVGRIDTYKTDCLILDSSRDNVVSDRIPEVFKKYGGMTFSDFDALPIMERLTQAYDALFVSTYANVYDAWAAQQAISAHDAAVFLNDHIDTLAQDEDDALEFHTTLRRWLGALKTLRNVLDFASAGLAHHLEASRRAFAADCCNLLNLRVDKQNNVSPEFHIERVELVHGEMGQAYEPKTPTRSKEPPPQGFFETLQLQDAAASFLDELAERLDREQHVEALRRGFHLMFTQIDVAGKGPHGNNDILNKKIKKHHSQLEHIPIEERMDFFKKLYRVAKVTPVVRSFASDKAWTTLFSLHGLLLDSYERWVLNGNQLTD